MKIALLAIVIVGLSVLMLGVKVLFVKNGKFPSGHVSHNAALRKKGIGCAAHEEKKK